jgi:hypothetical protein
MSSQKDNTTFRHKVDLRRRAMADCRAGGAEPVVLETHGGWGHVWLECYRDVGRGAVFETRPDKAESLARQRPAWAVYEADCGRALEAGAASHLAYNFVDVDPYGSPFGVVAAYLSPGRTLPDVWHLVVNDGLRQKVQIGGAWQVECLADVVRDYGNDLYGRYLGVAKEKIRRLAAAAGFGLAGWSGYHCGHNQGMTHYWAKLSRA